MCLGWAMLPVIDHHTTTTTTMMMKASSIKRGGMRLALYEGSPRALYSMGHPGFGECVCVGCVREGRGGVLWVFVGVSGKCDDSYCNVYCMCWGLQYTLQLIREFISVISNCFPLFSTLSDSKDLVPIPGCILTCTLQPHPTLAKASHLFPANVLVSYSDIIPGLTPTSVREGVYTSYHPHTHTPAPLTPLTPPIPHTPILPTLPHYSHYPHYLHYPTTHTTHTTHTNHTTHTTPLPYYSHYPHYLHYPTTPLPYYSHYPTTLLLTLPTLITLHHHHTTHTTYTTYSYPCTPHPHHPH